MYKPKQITTAYILAGNTNVSPSLLDVLARSHDSTIRARVAENIATPLHTLFRLLQDHDSEVRSSLAQNPAAPKSILDVLSSDESADVRLSLAENHNLPDVFLQFLSTDENPYVSHRASLTLSRLATEPQRTVAA